MHLKPKRHFLGVLLFYAITTITSGPTGSSIQPDPLTSPEPLHPDPMQADGGPAGPRSSTLDPPQRRLKPRMVGSTGDSTFHKPRKTAGEWIYSLHSPPHGNCSKGGIQHVVQGKFYVTGQLQTNIRSLGFQSDSAAPAQPHRGRPRVRGQRVSSPEESWQKLQPVVECGDDSMTLTVRKRRAVQLLLDRANESSLPLFQLSPHCGYTVQTTWRDLSLKSQYDACHITREADSYVLPLLWRGTPVRMSCPVSQVTLQPEGPSSLCCSPYGMTVRVPGLSATDEHRVNVRGEWTPLVPLAEQCGYTLDRQGDETVIAAPFVTCGITVKDEKYTLALETGNEIFLLACPVSAFEQFPITHPPLLNSPPHSDGVPNTPMLGSLEPLPWAPPFYLAPPYYPHPTSRHSSSQSEVQDSSNSPSPLSLPQESSFKPRSQHNRYSHKHYTRKLSPHEYSRTSPSPIDEMDNLEASYLKPKLENEKQNQETLVVDVQHSSTPTGFPAQVEAPHVPPPRHDHSPYYHYYHHPKIPVHITSLQHPDPGSEPSAVQQPDDLGGVDLDQFLPPVHKPPPDPHMVHTNSPFPHKDVPGDTSHSAQPYPYYYFYHLPHVVGEAKRLSPSHPDKAEKTNVPDSHSVLGSPVPPDREYNSKSYIHDDKSEQRVTYSPFLSEDDVKPIMQLVSDPTPRSSAAITPVPRSSPYGADPATVPLPEQPSSPAVNHNSNPYQYYYHHPYYDYSLMYYGPESLFNVYNSMPQTPQTQESPYLAQPPPIKSPYDFQNGEENPYFYYYHQYHQPEVLRDTQELSPPSGKESEALPQSDPAPPAKFEYGSVEWIVQEAGRPSIPLPTYNSYLNLYPQQASRQLRPVEQPGSQERLDNEMEDHSKAGMHPPSASPCGFDPVSDPECSNSLDCCIHAVQDCTVGQYFLFVVPDSLVEPTVVPTAPSSEDGSESCTLQRLTSDLDIYVVPLDGCGVNKHIFGNTVLHLLEVQGIHPYQDGNTAHDILPVRLTVGCSSSPDSPGEVMFHVMDQLFLPPPPPTAIFVRLRIAIDESFTSFHPEAHLSLSLIRGRPLYVELSVLDPSEPGLVLLVHSCLAYTQEPYTSWMLVYDGCQKQAVSQLLPVQNSHHIQRIAIFSFLPLPLESSLHAAKAGGYAFMEDPEIYFMCLTEVCNSAESDCSLTCFKSKDMLEN